MYPPILPGRRDRSTEDEAGLEKRLGALGRDYEGSPWLTALVAFSGFLAVFAGSFAALFVVANLRNVTGLPVPVTPLLRIGARRLLAGPGGVRPPGAVRIAI